MADAKTFMGIVLIMRDHCSKKKEMTQINEWMNVDGVWWGRREKNHWITLFTISFNKKNTFLPLFFNFFLKTTHWYKQWAIIFVWKQKKNETTFFS